MISVVSLDQGTGGMPPPPHHNLDYRSILLELNLA